MKINLERFYGNKKVTKGHLSIEGSTFECYTLEARDPEGAATMSKYLLALPEGSYRMKSVFEDTHYNLRVSCRGTYHNARFEAGETPSDVAAGSIILGTGFRGNYGMEGCEKAMDALSRFLYQSFMEGVLDLKKMGSVTLTISKSADFVYVNEAEQTPTDFEEENWNLLEEMEN